MEMRPSRKLAAIMFTDLVGYSSLTEKDESKSMVLLEEHRAIVRSALNEFRGREIRTMGDGFLVEFGSSVDAVECAVAIQTRLHDRNREEKLENRIILRIGIHAGDVIYQGDDLHGTTVNVAARIEPLAPPAGIVITKQVRDQITKILNLPMDSLGLQKLKNIETPIELYSITLPWLVEPSRSGPGTRMEPSVSRRQARRVYRGIVLLAIAGMIVVVILAFLFSKRSSFFSPAPSPPETRDHSVWTDSIAVLPFENFTPDPDDDYFTDGMTEELIDALTRVRGLKVCARTSVFVFKNRDIDIRTIGRKLGVSMILEGSVREAEDTLKISVQLIQASDGFHVWSDTFTMKRDNVFTIQESIAGNVVRNMKIHMKSKEDFPVLAPSTLNPQAYHLFLKGRYYWNLRTEEDILQAQDLFEQALDEDPTYALPYLGLAETYVVLPSIGGLSGDEAYPKAEMYARKALDLDPTLGEAHAALGVVQSDWNWDWDEATRQFEQAARLKPGYATLHQWYASHLISTNKLDGALREARLAFDLDPLSPVIHSMLAEAYHYRREYGMAERAFREIVKQDPNFIGTHMTLGLVLMHQQRYEEALAEVGLEKDYTPYWSAFKDTIRAYIYTSMGERKQAHDILDTLIKEYDSSEISYPSLIALLYAALGEKDEAIQWLDRSFSEKDLYVTWIYLEPAFDPLRTDPRYLRIFKRVGLDVKD
ncbi:MAG TPA: adenylate/guanylate cyclase domain-containing protein [Thermoanaerobaculia bacterium]|nr:adenylate/guanylate cyclase domain-containing protein [Thermoanaerobaculia bacterium]HUM28548.1 adenylate/guanylate cyclase domain-containing protein [Thermoanaerobaculia bacterium]HXK66844.1 adenylate/guanylate cyclase domain-containing protein [Thermoanaerobaculia bacterium]